MSLYNVYVPVVGTMTLTVEAEDEDSAQELRLDIANEVRVDVDHPNVPVELDFECLKQIVKGNVFCGARNEIEVKLIDEKNFEKEDK